MSSAQSQLFKSKSKKEPYLLYDPMAVNTIMMIFPKVTYTTDAKSALENADGCLVMTKWSEYAKQNREYDAMKIRAIIDGRQILTNFDAEVICR